MMPWHFGKTRCDTEESEEFYRGILYMKKQTAGREHLGELAPKFAELNDDVLFGEVWSRESQLSLRDCSMITITALFSAGLYPQLKSHLILGKEHGVTKEEAIEIATQLAFYCGWPKAWSTFPMIAEVWGEEDTKPNLAFPIGEPGAFRTSFYDFLHGASRAISDYTPSVGLMRLENMVNNHDQKGDPDKAGKLIVELVSSGNLPKRLPLGSDAVRIIRDELKSRLAEVEKTESYSITTDY